MFIGEGCEIAAGVRLTGPVVIGERLPRSARAPRSATRSCGPAPRSTPGTVLIGAVAGDRPLAEKL